MEETDGELPPPKTCGSCRRVGTDLKICTACRSVHYCNVTCQKAHRKAHMADCKEIAHAKEVMKEFKENPTTEECPICMMRLPLGADGFHYRACCGKTICVGCIVAHRKAQGLDFTDPDPPCAFCRRPTAKSAEEVLERFDERINKHGDGMAFSAMASYYREGEIVPKDDGKAFECYVKASEMGSPHGMYNAATSYKIGADGVSVDMEKAKKYFEMAARIGHVEALTQLGMIYQLQFKNNDVSIQYMRLAAENGDEDAMKCLRNLYRFSLEFTSKHDRTCICYSCNVIKNLLTKDDLAVTIRTFHIAQDRGKEEAGINGQINSMGFDSIVA